MQTFLPYPSFKRSASVLDYRRLGKQRLEARQIINTLELRQAAWRNHPAVLMWSGYVRALKVYHDVIIKEWISRGFVNNCVLFDIGTNYVAPPWLGDERLHSSHRASLLFKLPEWYCQFNWAEASDPKIEYFWPVRKDSVVK